jgi:hypothetical protein
MSNKPPKGPGWENRPGTGNNPNSIAYDSEEKKLKELKERLPELLKMHQEKHRGRVNQFYPYILIRSVVGDRGDRPINVPFWESPDIWTAPGDPSVAPVIPSNHGGSLTAGQPHTVYAHVWNLGRAPIAGVKVEFYWFDPSLSFDEAHAHLIGVTRVDLGPRSSVNCHSLVKCPKAWVPQMVNNGHECLVVRASAIGDNISASHPWEPWADRHIGQRNIHVAGSNSDLNLLLVSLNNTKLKESRIQLIQVGKSAAMTLRMMAPNLKMDSAVKPLVLAELRSDGSLHLPLTVAEVPGAQAPVTNMVKEPSAHIGVVARVIPHSLFNIAPLSKPVQRRMPVNSQEILTSGGNLTHLLGYTSLLSPSLLEKIKSLKLPKRNQAQVLRIVSFNGDQIVGGYTLIVHG